MAHPSGVFTRHPSGVFYRHPSGVFGVATDLCLDSITVTVSGVDGSYCQCGTDTAPTSSTKGTVAGVDGVYTIPLFSEFVVSSGVGAGESVCWYRTTSEGSGSYVDYPTTDCTGSPGVMVSNNVSSVFLYKTDRSIRYISLPGILVGDLSRAPTGLGCSGTVLDTVITGFYDVGAKAFGDAHSNELVSTDRIDSQTNSFGATGGTVTIS